MSNPYYENSHNSGRHGNSSNDYYDDHQEIGSSYVHQHMEAHDGHRDMGYHMYHDEQMSIEKRRLCDILSLIDHLNALDKMKAIDAIGDVSVTDDAAEGSPVEESSIQDPTKKTRRRGHDRKNTSVWLTGLPCDTTVASLLAAITDIAPIGKIYATAVNKPDTKRGHQHAAAKIVFWTHEGAQCLRDAIMEKHLLLPSDHDPAGFRIPVFQWNRVKAEAPKADDSRSRVLLMKGPHVLVNEKFLRHFFDAKFRYDTEYVRVLRVTKRETTLEWAFGGYRYQAAVAFKLLRQEMDGDVTVSYTRDPCT
ncbi:hypothetical protein ACHAQH_002913 [Verticillium albo-atrum]